MRTAKAWAAAISAPLTVLAGYFLAGPLGIDGPSAEAASLAGRDILTLLVTGALPWLFTYLIPNKES